MYKRTSFFLLASLLMTFFFSACGEKFNDDYNKLMEVKTALEGEMTFIRSEIDQAKEEIVTLQQEKDNLEKELESANKEIARIQREYDSYKEKMKPFDEMTAAQAEEERIRAEQEVARLKEEEEKKKEEEKLAEEKRKAEEEAAKAAEEAKGYETGITYDQLARTPDDYIAKKIKFSGKVLQVMEGKETVEIRLAVNRNYSNVLYGVYKSDIVSSRVLEDDVITIYGYSLGLYSYKSTMGKEITIPSVIIDRIDQ